MEQNMNASAPMAGGGKLDGGNGLKIAAVVASVVAVCGVGFGVYGMTRSLQKDDSSTVVIVDDDTVVSGVSDSKDYIFIGEWGLKIKKPENWRDLIGEYAYYNDYPHAVDTFEIMEKGGTSVSQAVITPGSGDCKDNDSCTEIKIGEDNTFDVTVPKVGSGSVSESFRNWVTDSKNFSKI
ncbi:MAG: hypothetical protein Q4A79_00295 [Candidatus Saccharibacteria bacterium]|nr:hypothetical protein [Candidatus Saccharibacteria bacterium]